MKIIAIIPARYASSRFPGKPLANILGKSMIQHVYERVMSVSEIKEIYVATDDKRIFDAVEDFGGNVVMTGECACGTDRVASVCRNMDFDVVLNVQGDEPAIEPEMLRQFIRVFDDNTVEMATLKKEIKDVTDISNPNIAKLLTDKNNDAIYFSRSAIPFNRDKRDEVRYYRHIGIYGYKKATLEHFVTLPRAASEIAEELEQLRALENRIKIRVAETHYNSIGVDLPEHISIVEEYMRNNI